MRSVILGGGGNLGPSVGSLPTDLDRGSERDQSRPHPKNKDTLSNKGQEPLNRDYTNLRLWCSACEAARVEEATAAVARAAAVSGDDDGRGLGGGEGGLQGGGVATPRWRR